MKHQNRFSSGEEHSTESQSKKTTLEFSNAEELLRHEARNIEVPPAIAERLNESIQKQPRPQASWWQRLFGA